MFKSCYICAKMLLQGFISNPCHSIVVVCLPAWFFGYIPSYFAVVCMVVPDCECVRYLRLFCDICDVDVNCDIFDKAVINVCELFCWVSLCFKYKMCIV